MEANNTVAQLKERLNKDSNDIEAAISLGNIYYDSGDAGQAILYYRRALDINPDLSGVRTDLGTMYWRNDDISLAEQSFREVIKRDAGFGHAYVNLGFLLHRAKGDVAGARAIWQQLLAVNPNHDVAGKARELLQETALLAM
ncbi:MAG: tetratricopeptide repeat protein [Nitrosomonadales bacterium]|nr:tetratricopeptide repeat protein [Nitrosomonadales bacterium]